MNQDSGLFIEALQRQDLAALRKVPKADLHNHFMLGGDRKWIRENCGIQIDPVTQPLASMAEMDQCPFRRPQRPADHVGSDAAPGCQGWRTGAGNR